MAFSIKHSSLRSKVLYIILSITGLSMLLMSFASFDYYKTNVRNQKVNDQVLFAQAVGSSISAALSFGDKGFAEETLAQLEERKSIIKVCVYDDSKRLFVSYYGFSSLMSECKAVTIGSVASEFRANILYISRPIRVQDDIIGFITIVSDVSALQESIISYGKTLLLIGLVVMVIAYFLATKLQRIITSPVNHLLQATERISREKDYSITVEKVQDDELGLLTDNFNQMLEAIHKSDLELRKAKTEAEKANKLKSEFLANISHELRTPLHGILSYSDMIRGYIQKDEIPMEKLKKRVDAIHSSGNRLLILLNDLLDLSRLEAGMMNFDFDVHNLQEVIESVVNEMDSLLKDKSLTVKIENEATKTDFIFDKNRITQVFYNLLSNAVKFTPEGKTIRVALFDHHKRGINYAGCSVIDEGVGVPDDELEAVFDKFTQSSKTNSGAGGTGLGLSICREIVDVHEGQIWAENNGSAPGCTFTFLLPVNKSLQLVKKLSIGGGVYAV